MKQTFLFLLLFILWVWSAPNVDRFTQIFGREGGINEEGASGYIDSEGKLWILGIKWHTERKVMEQGPIITILPDGKVNTFPAQTKVWENRTYPYLCFWLYDENANKINEGTLGDSVSDRTLFTLQNGGALVIWRCRTDINVRMGNPTSGYVKATFINKNGEIKDDKVVTLENATYYIMGNFMQGILIGLAHHGIIREKKKKLIRVSNDTILICNDFHDIPRFKLLQQLDSLKFLVWTRVDSVLEYGYDEHLDRTYWKNYILLKDQIEIKLYDAVFNEWISKRYCVFEAHFRKYIDFDLYPLKNFPTIKDYPEVQSVKLKNGNIVVTILMKEADKPVAYQMLFDSLGQFVASDEFSVLKPLDISKIPEGSKMYIRREPIRYTNLDEFMGAYIYIYGDMMMTECFIGKNIVLTKEQRNYWRTNKYV